MATITKSTGTVTLTGDVEKVTLPSAYGWVWLKNMSDADMFAGLSADISEGADGVMVIPAGECGRIQTDGFDFVYLLGAGNALVVAQNYADCPFKVGAKGGEIPDLSEYALRSKYGDTAINLGRKAGTTVGLWSTAEGYNTTASGFSSHAEGLNTTASGDYSHAEGEVTTASGDDSHAEGYNTTASGTFSHSGGAYTKALHDNEVAYGKFNLSNDDTLFSVGDGTADDARHNAFEITISGGKLHDKDIATIDLIPIIKSINFSAATTYGYIWTGIPFPKYVIGVDLGHFDVFVQFCKGSNEAAARAEWAMMFFSRDDMTTPLNGSFNGTIYYID